MTRVALLTPQGRGAIATVAVRGPQAIAAVAGLFAPNFGARLDATPHCEHFNRLRYGRWNGPAGEETIVCVLDAETVEVHCHGGIAAAEAILASLLVAHCQRFSWDDLLLVAEPDPIRRAALEALARAATERAAAILLDQYAGALRRQIEAAIDAIRAQDLTRAKTLIAELLDNAPIGRHLVEPFRVVLIGRPNVGKSSLINALVGYARAIVHETPGTTRDAVTATTAIDGWPVELVDTAGMHATSDPVELAGVARAREHALAADLVLLVVDRSAAPSPADAELLAAWPHARVVYSKCDLPPAQVRQDDLADCLTSATTGFGIAELLADIAARLVPNPPAQGAAVPFETSQFDAIAGAARQLDTANVRAAEDVLAKLLDEKPASNTMPA